MPTNKMWLEHTERAAWDSVQALREKLKAAEKRLAALTPAGGGWEQLLDELDRANEELGLARDYTTMVLRLVERVKTAESRVAVLEKIGARGPSRR